MKREVFLKYRTLGRTGLNVSEISLGTVELGLDYGIPVEGEVRRPPEEAAARLLHQALDLGINMIDTARAYGESESIIGRALEGRRREYVLATKVQTFHEMKLSHSDLAARMTASVEQSLQALRTDFVDVLMLHSAPTTAFGDGPFEEILLRLKSRGWCRYLGASVYGEQSALAAIRSGAYDCLQVAYSILDRRPEREVIPEAARENIGLVARSVLLKGVLTHRCRQLPDSLSSLKSAVENMAALLNGDVGSLPELAYRYVLAHQIPQTALVGTGSIAELEQAVGFTKKGALPEPIVEKIRDSPMPPEHDLNPGNWPAM